MKLRFGIICAIVSVLGAALDAADIPLLPGEHWWGGKAADGVEMPFSEKSAYDADFSVHHGYNHAAPFLVSDMGRYIWREDAFALSITSGVMRTSRPVVVVDAGRNLREAFLAASKRHFPPSGKMPPVEFIAAPQYNTWIELQYNQNQDDILKYARDILANGLPPGVLMIDDTWQAGYGDWRFEVSRFHDPAAMCRELHGMGFKVMLWIVPFVSMDSPAYRRLRDEGGLVERTKGDPAVVGWWNGKSALLDFSHPNGVKWFRNVLARLQLDYGVDGFKFDGGDIAIYRGERHIHTPMPPEEQMRLYSAFGLEFPYNEYRASWKTGGQPLVQRLCDKFHAWSEVARCIADMTAAGLIGHPFVCPDMIGGGDYVASLPDSPFDQELFIRSAQVHALAPMMQFSASPWRVLDEAGRRIIRETVALRQKFAPWFVELAETCAKTGEPMLRAMEYNWPHLGLAKVKDQFAMGDSLIVAPQIAKGAKTRTVALPSGKWRGDDGAVIVGPATITVNTPLDRLPHFVKE